VVVCSGTAIIVGSAVAAVSVFAPLLSARGPAVRATACPWATLVVVGVVFVAFVPSSTRGRRGRSSATALVGPPRAVLTWVGLDVANLHILKIGCQIFYPRPGSEVIRPFYRWCK